MRVKKGENDLKTVNPRLAAEWDFSMNGSLKPDEIAANSNKKVWWVCEKGHHWEATVASRNRGAGCPICSNKETKIGYNDLTTTAPELLKYWDYVKNDIDPTHLTKGSTKTVWWKCERGHSFRMSVNGMSRGRRCPYCAGQKVLPGYNDLATTMPDLAAEWDYEKNKNLSPREVTQKSHKRVWWKCKYGHSWEAVISSRSQGFGCPYCSGRLPIQGENDLLTVNPDLCREWNVDRNNGLTPDQFKPNSHVEVWWRCAKCGDEWKAFISDRNQGNGCPSCNKMFRTSTPEQILYYYISQAFQDAVSSYKPEWLPRHGSEFDIYIPSLHVAVEYDGERWHQDVEKDYDKNRRAKAHGIELIRVREQGCPDINIPYVIKTGPTKQDMQYMEHVTKELFSVLREFDSDIVCPQIEINEDLQSIIASFSSNRGKKSLLYQYPAIAAEWNAEKNGRLTSAMITAHSNKKVWWKCSKCGFEWSASVNNRIRRGCPACAGKAVFRGVNDFATLYPELAKEWNSAKNGNLNASDITIGYGKKVWWKCSKCGFEWSTEPYHRTRGRGCPACAGKAVWKGHNDFATLYPQLASEWNYKKNEGLDPTEITPGVTKRVWWKCSICGNEWQTSVGNRTGRKSGCPKCAQNRNKRRNGKAVRQYSLEGDFIKEYPSISEAMKETGAGSIAACCKHIIRTSGGYRWQFADDE